MKKTFTVVISMLAGICLSAQTFNIPTASVGDLSITITNSGAWELKANAETMADGREMVNIYMTTPVEAVPAPVTISFNVPLVDMSHTWYCLNDNDRNPLKPEWSFKPESQIASDMPLLACFNDDNTNRLTFACNDPFHYIKFNCGVREEGTNYCMKMQLFSRPEAPIKEYSVKLLFDRRNIFWSKPIEQAAEWMTKEAGITPCRVPEGATQPLYSSWYQFHQGVSASEIEAECKLASKIGLKTIILDDGWQTDDGGRGYAYCGDWQPTKNKFPDMKAHVDAVHKMGMKYMMWYSVPHVGKYSQAYKTFQGKTLQSGKGNTDFLDPRFPEVREYLVNIYETAMKQWGIDGFKLDFIDRFKITGEDPAIAQNYAGRDIKSLTDAVDVLMKEIYARLSAINPDVLIEFRQHYIGPAIRQYGNMLRVTDCPADYHSNRIRSANLRLTSGQTAVHSDMLEWNPQEAPEVAARQILSSLFATVQYSLMLRDISPEQKKMMTHWIDFTQKHKQTLLYGEFLPYYPQSCFPVIEARSAKEQICGLYQSGMSVNVSPVAPKSFIINATGSNEVIVNFAAAPKQIKLFDTYGEQQKSDHWNCGGKILPGKPCVLNIPTSGYAEIVW